jgi:hypothetical protein
MNNVGDFLSRIIMIQIQGDNGDSSVRVEHLDHQGPSQFLISVGQFERLNGDDYKCAIIDGDVLLEFLKSHIERDKLPNAR